MDWNTIGSLASAFFSAAAFVVALWLALKRIPDEIEKLKVTRREEQRALVAEQLWIAASIMTKACVAIDLRRILGAQTTHQELLDALLRPREDFVEALEGLTEVTSIAQIWYDNDLELSQALSDYSETARAIARETFDFMDAMSDRNGISIKPAWQLKDSVKVLGEEPWARLKETQQRVAAVVFPIVRHEERKPRAASVAGFNP